MHVGFLIRSAVTFSPWNLHSFPPCTHVLYLYILDLSNNDLLSHLFLTQSCEAHRANVIFCYYQWVGGVSQCSGDKSKLPEPSHKSGSFSLSFVSLKAHVLAKVYPESKYRVHVWNNSQVPQEKGEAKKSKIKYCSWSRRKFSTKEPLKHRLS